MRRLTSHSGCRAKRHSCGSYPLALNRLRNRPWVQASPENFVIFHIFPGAAWW